MLRCAPDVHNPFPISLQLSEFTPPVGDYSVVTRDDGGKQIAYKGKPLYYWIKDTKAGDKTGDGVNNVWHLVKP